MPVYVKELMTKKVYSITPEASVRKAAEEMAKRKVSALVVVKGARTKKPIGIITKSDIIEKIVSKNKTPSKIKVEKVMSEPVITINQNQTILDAARKLRRNNIKRLPVIDNEGNLVGIISVTDIAITSPELIDLLEKRLEMREEEMVIKEKTTVGICDECGNYSPELRFYEGEWVCPDCLDELMEE